MKDPAPMPKDAGQKRQEKCHIEPEKCVPARRRVEHYDSRGLNAPDRLGSAPTEKEEAPRAELTDAGQSSRALGWGARKKAR